MSDKLLDTNEEPFDISQDYEILDLQYMRGRLDSDTFVDDEVKRYYWKAYKSPYKHIEILENQYNTYYEVIADAQVKLAEAYNDVDTIIEMLGTKATILEKGQDIFMSDADVVLFDALKTSIRLDVDKITEMGYTVPEKLKELLF